MGMFLDEDEVLVLVWRWCGRRRRRRGKVHSLQRPRWYVVSQVGCQAYMIPYCALFPFGTHREVCMM
jgi:hypothetical protein